MTIGERLRAVASDLVGEAFLADIHNMDGHGPREIEKLTGLFENKLLDFMLAERELEKKLNES